MPKPSEEPCIRMTRRDFSRGAAAAAAGLVAAAVPVSAQSAPIAGDGETDTVVLSITSRCPGLLPSETAELKDQVKGILDLSSTLRKHAVTNGTEPDFVFHASEAHGASR